MLGHGGYQAYGHGWEHHSRGGLHPHGGGPSCRGGLHPHGGGEGCRGRGGHHRHGWGLHVGPQSRGWGHFVNPRGHMTQGRGAQIHGGHPIHLHGHIAKDWGTNMLRERCIRGVGGGEDHSHGAAHSGGRGGGHGRGGRGGGRGGGGPRGHG